MHRFSWHSPPDGILKLNFDGSHVQHFCMGGIGGVICAWSGQVLKNFQDPLTLWALMVLKYMLYWLVVMSCRNWEGIMQSLKETLFLLFSWG